MLPAAPRGLNNKVGNLCGGKKAHKTFDEDLMLCIHH